MQKTSIPKTMKTPYLALVRYYIGDGTKGVYTLRVPIPDLQPDSQKAAVDYINASIPQAKGNAWLVGWEVMPDKFHRDFLWSLLDAKQYDAAAKYYWINANMLFNAYEVWQALKSHDNFEALNKAYENTVGYGELTDQP